MTIDANIEEMILRDDIKRLGTAINTVLDELIEQGHSQESAENILMGVYQTEMMKRRNGNV